MQDISKIWKEVPANWRHLNECSSNVQNNLRIIDCGLNDLRDVRTILDWGPGGGFLSRQICRHIPIDNVIFVDIVEDHFDRIKSNFAGLDVDLDFVCMNQDIDVNCKNVDLLLAFSVIYHFPNLLYANYIINHWVNVIRPRTIWLRNIFTDRDTWQNDHLSNPLDQGINFLRGVVYNREMFLGKFRGYKLLKNYEKDKAQTDATNIPNDLATYSEVMLLERDCLH